MGLVPDLQGRPELPSTRRRLRALKPGCASDGVHIYNPCHLHFARHCGSGFGSGSGSGSGVLVSNAFSSGRPAAS